VLRRAGTQFVGLCPFHRERRASFYVHPEKQLFHCFGCGAGGDVFTFIQQIERVDFLTAAAILSQVAGVPVDDRPLTRVQKREYARQLEELEIIEHFRLVEGHPEREARRVEFAYRAACTADPELKNWLRRDLAHAQEICVHITAMIAEKQRRDGKFPVKETA
jgi:DNA primase